MPRKRKRPRVGAGGSTRTQEPRPRRPEPPPPLVAVPPPVEPGIERALTIVGVGASAGGLEAFSTVLKALPARPGVVIVFVQHLAPQHESALVPLLSGQSQLPVVQATHGMVVEADHVYVIPPNAQMVIVDRTLHLNARPDDRSQYTPVDAFFASLAESAGSHAIGIILSGTASDGALGIRDIKAAGGVTIAQTPESAKYDGMPRAAIATGMVDVVLPPKQIRVKLAELYRHAYIKTTEKATIELPVTEDELHEVFEVLRPASGVDFRHYKLPTIKR